MVRSTDQETKTIEKIVCHSQLPRGGATSHHTTRGHTGKPQGGQEKEREGEQLWARASIVVSAGRNERGSVC